MSKLGGERAKKKKEMAPFFKVESLKKGEENRWRGVENQPMGKAKIEFVATSQGELVNGWNQNSD